MLIREDESEAGVRSNKRQEALTLKRAEPRAVANVLRVVKDRNFPEAKALLAAGKGSMTLNNGDIIKDGKILLAASDQEMDETLTPLPPVLSLWFSKFNTFIPLTTFNREFLLLDQQAWSQRKAPTESKIKEGSSKVKVYGGSPPPEELCMHFEAWIDAMELFILYLEDRGKLAMAERFRGHTGWVKVIRNKTKWMVALRYCPNVRQAAMRETIDSSVTNSGLKIQQKLLDVAKQVCKNYGERAFSTNLYAPGGKRENVNPLTGQPRFEAVCKKAAPLEIHKAEVKGRGEGGSKPKKEFQAKREREGYFRRPQDFKREDRGTRYQIDNDRGRSWRDDQGRDRKRS